ncbi:hypothetical protein [Laspinema olomoucense]|nr:MULTISPECIES: hypothetical protein [unclassified Laspinema]MCT7973594.1 hypothetical protein [Laspinema sp. D3d]MCT7992360.1 hypothetical protein [Laspinema sp. D3c]
MTSNRQVSATIRKLLEFIMPKRQMPISQSDRAKPRKAAEAIAPQR